MKLVVHLLRAGLISALVFLAVIGLGLADAKHAESVNRVGEALVGGFVIGVAAALLLLVFRVGPALKVVFGLFCGPALPVLMFVPGLVRDGRHDAVGGIVFLSLIAGLLVGALDASRVWQRRRDAETV